MKRTSFASHRQALPQWLGLLFGLVLLSVLALPVLAAEADPPGRAGRISEVKGQVWVYATDSNEWITAARNRPVTTGDRLSTEADGRAEVRIGSTVLHVAPNTEVEVQRLDDEHVSLQLHSGSVNARLRTREAADEFSLRTNEGDFITERPGQYRFDRIDDTSSVTATSGQARYEADGTALPVQQGQRVEFWKERGVPQYSATDPRRDDFSNWVASENSRDERSVSARYVSPEMTGVEDLDRYGRWESQTEYGAVWIPRTVVTGWAPYRMGHWAWISPWGWTWVDDAPWGFAPFHYGRWVWYRNAWCWAPGRYVARPVYAPALVAWVGRPGVNVSVRVGSAPTVGWFPLGPREVYVPGYRVSPRYVQNVNVTHVTNITNVTTIINNPGQAMANARYVNRGLPQAVTVVPAQVVERRQPVAPAFSPVNERTLRELRNERPIAAAPVVAPPRFQPGTPRQVVDPRVSRPGAPRLAPAREAEPGRPQAPTVITSPRGQDRDRDGRDGRDRDGRGGPDVRNGPDVRDGRDGRDVRDGRGGRNDDGRDVGRGGRDASIGRPTPTPAPAPAQPVQPVQPTQPGFIGRPGADAPDRRNDRERPDTPRVVTPAQPVQPAQPTPAQPAPARPPAPGFSAPPQRERERADPPREERRVRHHDASPPVQAPQPVQAPPAQRPQVQPAPVRQAPPPQVMRPPVVQQPREAQAPRVREEPRERQERGERPERGERMR
jgi:hypothetical protein